MPRLAWLIYRTLYASWRVQIIEPPELENLKRQHKPFILAHWHGDELAQLFMVRHFGLATMISTSRDGEIMNYLVRKFGGTSARGSSTRGGAGALKGLIKLCRKGHPTSIAVDGPKGPIYQVKPGIFELSRLTGAPIFSIGVYAEKKYVAHRSWNKAILPKPFSKVVVTFQPYLEFDKTMDAKDPRYADELATLINKTNQQAKALAIHN